MTAVFATSPAGAGAELTTGATSFVTATAATLGTIISTPSGFAFFSLLSL